MDSIFRIVSTKHQFNVHCACVWPQKNVRQKWSQNSFQMHSNMWKIECIYLPYHSGYSLFVSRSNFEFDSISLVLYATKKWFGFDSSSRKTYIYGQKANTTHGSVWICVYVVYCIYVWFAWLENFGDFHMNTQTCNSQNEIFRWENFSIYHCIRVFQFFVVFISPFDFEAFSHYFILYFWMYWDNIQAQQQY